MKKITAFILVLLMVVGSIFVFGKDFELKTNAENYGFVAKDFLKVSGTNIKNNRGVGETVYLRGTNAGGWLVQEEWMNPTNAPDQKTMMNTFASRFGTAGRDELIAVYEDNYWTEADFDNCAALGMSVIRLPFTYMNLVDDSHNMKSDAFKRLDWFVNECSERGIYVILDLHGAFGSQNGMDHSGEVNDGYQLYWNDYNTGKTVWLWEQVANHYKGNPAVAGYDILNEPGPKAGLTGSAQWDFYDRIYDAIRAIDADHIIIMESCWNPSDLPNPNNYAWTNVMYEYHYYPWDYVSDANGQKGYTDQKITDVHNANYGVPTFVGEFTCFGEIDAWYYTLEKYNQNQFHWTSWSYKALSSYGSWGIYNHSPQKVDIYNDSFDTIKQKWSTVGANNSFIGSGGMVYDAIKTYTPGVVNPAPSFSDSEAYYIKAEANNNYFTASNSSTQIVANSSNKSDSGKFGVVNHNDGKVSIVSLSVDKYICAVLDESNQLVPRSNLVGTWEKFTMTEREDSGYYSLIADNGKYVQIVDGVPLATSDTPQYFYFEPVTGGTNPPEQPTNPPEQPTNPPEQGSADLVITDIVTNPTDVKAGDPVTFSARVKNQGTAATPAGSIVGVRFSVDGLNNQPFTWDDTYTQSIPAGETVTITATGGEQGKDWTATVGNHTIYAWVDDQGRISETNTSNNTYTKQINVTESVVPEPQPGLSDPYVSAVVPQVSTINDGDSVTFSAIVRNMGENLSGALKVTFYIDNKELQTVDVAGGIDSGSFTVVKTTEDWNSFMGSHTVKAVVSESTTNLDTDGTNNLLKSRFNVLDI